MSREETVVRKFKEKASVVHNNRYDYSRVVFCDAKTKVEIICPKHGSFFQRKDSHVKGAGCKKCLYENMPLKRTVEETIQKFKDVHGELYDYSLVNKSKTTEKVDIICQKHGIFRQTIAHHLTSRGCPECSFDEQRLSLDEFLLRCRRKHGEKYDYSLVSDYAGFQTQITIVCPEHGEFQQQAGSHSLGKGCRKCGLEASLAKRYSEYTTENFIKKVQAVHGDRYDYSLAEYVNTETKVKIICKVHGMFEQRPKCHENGKGCVKCRNENTTYNFIQKYRDNAELGKSPGIIYILKVQGNGEEFLKLGITSNKSGRFKRYRKQFKDVGYSHETLFERVMPNYQTAMLENEIFKKFRREDKIYKPLQDFSGKSECILPDCMGELQSLILEHTEDKYFE